MSISLTSICPKLSLLIFQKLLLKMEGFPSFYLLFGSLLCTEFYRVSLGFSTCADLWLLLFLFFFYQFSVVGGFRWVLRCSCVLLMMSVAFRRRSIVRRVVVVIDQFTSVIVKLSDVKWRPPAAPIRSAAVNRISPSPNRRRRRLRGGGGGGVRWHPVAHRWHVNGR